MTKSVLICSPGRCGMHWVAYVLRETLGLSQLPTYRYKDSDWKAREITSPGWLYLTHDPIGLWKPAQDQLDIVCVVRNPMDVVVSAVYYRTMREHGLDERAQHKAYWGIDTDEHTSFQALLGRIKMQGHNPRWWQGYMSNKDEVKHTVVRYEDMHEAPLSTFTDLLRAMKRNVPNGAIARAVVSQMKQAFPDGRGEMDVSKFFRRGIVDEWKEHYTPEEADKFREFHKEEMREFGYY